MLAPKVHTSVVPHESEDSFCADLADLSGGPLAALRSAKAAGTTPARTAAVFAEAASRMEAMQPPSELASDWLTAVEAMNYFGDCVQSVQRRSEATDELVRRYTDSFNRVTSHAVTHCGMTAVHLFP